MSPAAQEIIERLDGTRQKWWLFTLLSTAVLAGCISFGILLFFMAADALIRFSQIPLALMFGVWFLVTIALLVLVGRRLARSQRSLEATARRVEAEFPEVGSDLINLVQLASDAKNGDPAFCDAAIRQAAQKVGRMHFDQAAAKETRFSRFVHCMQTPRDLGESVVVLAALIAIAVVCQFLIPSWGSAANRLLKPWSFVPSVGSVRIVSVTPGNTEVLVGSSLEIAAEIKNTEERSYKATLFVTPDGDQENTVTMASDQKFAHYKVALPSILKPLKYRLEIGDSQTETYLVKTREKPTIAEVEVTLNYPPYLGRAAETSVQKDADLEAPQYTVAELKIRPSATVANGYVQMEAQRFAGRVEDGGKFLVVKLPLLKDSAFQIHMANDAGHTDPNPRVNRIHVVPDRPPTVELLKPARQESAAPGADVPVMIRAGDDYGVGRVRLEMKIKNADAEGIAEAKPAKGQEGKPTGVKAAKGDEGKSTAKVDGAKGGDKKEDGKIGDKKIEQKTEDDTPPVKVQEWTKFEGNTAVVLSHRLELAKDKVKAGQSVMIRAVAADKRDFADWGLDLRPQETATGWHVIKVISPEAKVQAALEQADNLRSAIWKILEKQVRARIASASIREKKELAQRTAAASEVRPQQVDIQKATMGVVGSIQDNDKEDRKTIKRILNQLAFGEMLHAVQLGDELVKQKTVEGFNAPLPKLLAAQDKIIEVLRKMLDVTRQAQTEALAEMKKKRGDDLPDDTKKKLEEMRKKLEGFLKQQKKVIEASENLAKKPTEDFSEKEEQLLKQLAQAEDDWAKFMKEAQTDLSKLPEQDFSNSTMAKELNEIQTELKMAEDALLKKSADIAVPLEQLGYERAEEITTNLEKWLPDTPDREKWSQEEALSDADKEAPAAELPGELEDLVGDLMEDQEDLMDEMEDVTSSAMDSIDKGAGWDVTDGPISNMSAKGATGNRLPNTNEIGGRSGEGRQAKSSGEFVGDEAVGKGGRKTPSRLTPDPIMKGQIKDHSKDPTGGATGGGKESGQGGEGLEGPAPKGKGPRDMQRLAGKQAALRNKAEGVDLQFQVGNFHHTDMKKILDAMSKILDDVKAGNYQNVLRQRQALAEKAANVKQYLEGEFQVKKDATANLPTDIQKEILGGMQDPSPAGWEELNRQYFERLSAASGGGAAAVPPPAAPEAGKAPVAPAKGK